MLFYIVKGTKCNAFVLNLLFYEKSFDFYLVVVWEFITFAAEKEN